MTNDQRRKVQKIKMEEGKVMCRTFICEDQEWEVLGSNGGFGTGTGPALPRVSDFSVKFRCISDPKQGPYYGHVPGEDLDRLPVECLIEALKEAMDRDK